MKIIPIAFFVLLASHCLAQSDKANNNHINEKNGVALSGYDPVSYFIDGPKKGSGAISSSHKGVTYYFASEESRNTFASSPETYTPAYGGWCAYAIAEDGSKVKINPETYIIQNGKLLLFYNRGGTNTLDYWKKDQKGYFDKAERNWSKIVQDK